MRDFLMVLFGKVDEENTCIRYKNITITRYSYGGLYFKENDEITLKTKPDILWMLFDSRLGM